MLELIRINADGERVQFRPDAAASFLRYENRIGRKADVNRTVVTYAEQEELYDLRLAGKYPYSVAHPKASNHVYRSDTDGGNAWDTDERNYELLEEYGWVAVWNDPSQEPYEPWHLEYFRSRDKHLNEGIPEDMGVTAPIVNVVPKYGESKANGTIYIGSLDGSFHRLNGPFDPNVRGVVSVVFFGAKAGDRDDIPVINPRDFQTVQGIWRTMCGK